ncbi:MAG TPA: HAD family hydrolase [Casimicrobiaceae bacterium]
MTVEVLLFDVDGTLADTEETHRQAFNYAFVQFGLGWEWTRPLYRDLLRVSGGKERIAHFIGTLGASPQEKARLTQLVPAIHRAKTSLYTELIADGRCPLRPGVARLLAEHRECQPVDSCVAFEDSKNGLRAAKAAALYTVVTPSQWTDGDDMRGADLVLAHLGEPAAELPPGQAAAVGGPWLGLDQLRRLHGGAVVPARGPGW